MSINLKIPDIRELKLRDWQPRSMMVAKTTELERPKFPAIDVHNHLGGGKSILTPDRVAGYLREMNEAGVRTVVNLDGGWGKQLTETLDALDNSHPDRFLTFALLNFDRIDDAELLLAGAQCLLAQLTGWLCARQLAVERIVLQLEHERGRVARAPTCVDIVLAEPLAAVPPELSEWYPELADDGHLLRYQFDSHAERTGIASLMRRLTDLGIAYKDLSTHQSSLEEIFVELVHGGAQGASK